MSAGTPLPLWAESLTALLVVLGAAFAAIGAFGLVRLPGFFRRIHAPTLGATIGVWCITLATIVYFSVQGFHLFLHAVLIAVFIALTAPVTTIFVMRAALFRERQKKAAAVPPVAGTLSVPEPAAALPAATAPTDARSPNTASGRA